MAAAIVAGGCANTEELSGRRPEEYKNYSGTPYASDAVNEANLFGTEGKGLSSNPATKPSGSLLGSYDASIGPVTVKVVPTEVKAKTNEIIEVNVELSALSEEDGKTEVPVPKPMQIVAVLESGDMDANGSLVWSSKDSAGATLNENGAYSNKLVLMTSNDGKAKFRVQTGTLYNMDNPMYWVNVWSANADAPGAMAIHVQRPPRIGDPGLSEGSLDVFNDPSLDPEADSDILEALAGSKAVAAEMTAKLNTHQELFVRTEKTFSVHLVGTLDSEETTSSKMKPLAGEMICWKVVTDDRDGSRNDGNVILPKGIRCKETDENGDVEVVFSTGSVYNTKYYLNFYHQIASPVAFEIVTFVMPETLGTDGAPIGASDFLTEDGTLPEGMTVDLPSEEELETSPAGYPMMSTKDSQKVLEKIAETDVKLKEVLMDNCYNPPLSEEEEKDPEKEWSSDGKTFVCNLVQDESGTWTIWKQASCTDEKGNVRYVDSATKCKEKETWTSSSCTDKEGNERLVDPGMKCEDKETLTSFSCKDEEGNVHVVDSVTKCNKDEKATGFKPVMADMDGDGVKENVSLVIEEYCTASGGRIVFFDEDDQAYYLDDDGNRVNVDGDLKDCKGVFIGYDTTGDGTANTVPDPCTVDSGRPGCSGETTLEFRCSRDGGQSFVGGCGVQSYGIQEDVDIRTQLVDKDKVGKNGETVSYELLRSADERNNGAFKGGTSETEANASTSTYAHKSGASHDGVSSVVFHTGTAHSSAYYVTAINAQAHPVSYSYYVKYSVKLPTGEGDSPSPEDLEQAMNEPPADMPDKDPSVGSVLLVADGATYYNTVIAKTLILKARVVDVDPEKGQRPYSGTDVYWKVVRGASESNNGVLKNTKSKTDSQGYAMNEFFTGTGYDSTYYAIAYHPNCEQEPRDPRLPPCEPLVFTIHTENFSGTMDGPTGDPTSPCDPETDAHACKPVDGNGKVEGEDGYDPAGSGLGKIEGLNIIKTYPEGKDALCTDAELIKINKCLAGTDAACSLEGRKKGCLLFELLSNEDGAAKDTPTSSPGDEVRQAYTNKKEKINARLSWFDGSGWQIVDSRLYWTLDKSGDADGSLMYMKTLHSDDNMATNILKTGSAETKYRVNVSFPNIYTCDDYKKYTNCKLAPLSTVVNVQSGAFVDSENYPVNKLNLTFNEEIKTVSDEPIKDIGNVEIYIVSSDLNTCRTSFVLQPKAKRKAEYATMQTGRNPKISADHTWDVLTQNGKSYEIADQRESLLIYTIATDNSGNPIAYNCTENLSFPIKKKLPDKCKACGENCDTDCTNEIDKEITLTEVPTSVEGSYSTKTLFDIGPLLANEENVVHKKLMELATEYKKFMSAGKCGPKGESECTVGEQLVEKLFSYLVFEDVGGTDAKECHLRFCNNQGENKKWDYSGVDKCIDEYNKNHNYQVDICDTIGDKVKCPEGKNLHYKECGCICGKTYYYTQLDTMGKMLTPLIKKGLATLVDNVLGTDNMSMDEMICSILDSIQFIEFTGNVSLKGTSSSTQAFEGAFEYTGLMTPSVGGKNLSVDSNMSVIRGKWVSSSYENNQLTFNNVPVMISYGKLAYQILGSVIGLNDNGQVDLLGFINCEKIFSKDLNFPVIGSFDAASLVAMCKSLKNSFTASAIQFADAKEASTNIVFDVGMALADGKSSNCTDGKCQAKTLINGTWEGSGSFKATDESGQISTKKYDAAALWYAWAAASNIVTQEEIDALSYHTGDDAKDLDAWKKERSVCALLLDQADKQAQVEENPTNRGCLGGTFNGDSSERRDPEVNFCDLEACYTNPSIVVCTAEDVFNEKYANASQETILSDAMASCYKAYHEATEAEKTKIKEACDKNSEVMGWDAPLTNAACKGKCEGACALEENISIVVCGNEHGEGKSCFNKDDGYECYRRKASEACFTAPNNRCGGDCMNNLGEAVVCGEREDHVLAVWTNFDDNGDFVVFNNGTANNSGLDTRVRAGMLPDAGSCDANELVCDALAKQPLKLTVKDLPDGAKIKVVAGSDDDGKLAALGISKLGTGKITITLPELLKIWGDNASIESGNSECSDYQLTMKILGDGRKLKANWNVTEDGSGITTNGAYKLFTPATAKAPFHAEGKKEPFTLRMITNPEDESDKMLRIDEIKLTAKCYPYSENVGEGGGDTPAPQVNACNIDDDCGSKGTCVEGTCKCGENDACKEGETCEGGECKSVGGSE